MQGKKKLLKLYKIIFKYHKNLKDNFNLMIAFENFIKLQYSKSDLEIIIHKFMTIINTLIDQKTLTEGKEFLGTIFTKKQLQKILYNKIININLRTELINYYRKCFFGNHY